MCQKGTTLGRICSFDCCLGIRHTSLERPVMLWQPSVTGKDVYWLARCCWQCAIWVLYQKSFLWLLWMLADSLNGGCWLSETVGKLEKCDINHVRVHCTDRYLCYVTLKYYRLTNKNLSAALRTIYLYIKHSDNNLKDNSI